MTKARESNYCVDYYFINYIKNISVSVTQYIFKSYHAKIIKHTLKYLIKLKIDFIIFKIAQPSLIKFSSLYSEKSPIGFKTIYNSSKHCCSKMNTNSSCLSVYFLLCLAYTLYVNNSISPNNLQIKKTN